MAPFQLTSWQRHRLRRELHHTRDALLFRRILAVLEYDHGRSAADIARELGVTRQTVHLWVAAYAQRRDPEALADESGRGRPRLLDEDQQHFLEVLLTLAPQDLGFPHTSWTVPLLREAVEVATEQTVSAATIRRALHRLDYVWKRPRYDLEPDPEREKKTSDSPANPGPSPAQRRPGAGRNRPAALPAVAYRLVEAW